MRPKPSWTRRKGKSIICRRGRPARGRASTAPRPSWSSAGAQFALLPPENATGNFTKVVQRVPVRVALDANDPMLARLRSGLSVTAT